jgi:hypothetical protein
VNRVASPVYLGQAARRTGCRVSRFLRTAAAGGLAASLPKIALACPVCFAGGSERLLHAYYLTALFMTLLPLVIIGLFAGWLRRQFKNAPQ